MADNIFCPVCKCQLHVTHSARYESREEHISNPNGPFSMKDGYQCTNVSWCEASYLNYTWIHDGDYYSNPPEGISYSEASKRLKAASVSGMGYALNSWEHYYELGKLNVDKRKKTVHIGKYMIKIEPKTYGYDYPIEKQYMPRRFGWKFEFFQKTSDGCYTNIIPTYRMVRYCLRQFDMNYRSIKQNSSSSNGSIKEALSMINCTNWGRTPDDRLYAKISSFLVKLFYPKKVKYVREIAELNQIKY